MKIKDAESLANLLLKAHGLIDYHFEWSKRVKRFSRAGECNYKKKRIRMSPMFVELNCVFLVKQVILHEIAKEIGCVKYKGNKSFTCYGKIVKRAI